jgi:small membrane protein
MTIKFILLATLASFFVYILLLPRKSMLRKGFVLAFVLVMVAFVLNPEWSSAIAARVGVGRGVDLLFYLSHLALFFIAFVYYLKFKDVELRFTRLVQQLALEGARSSHNAVTRTKWDAREGSLQHRTEA